MRDLRRSCYVKTKSLESFIPNTGSSGLVTLNSDCAMVLAVRAGRSPAARFLTLNEEWATMAIRALRPQPTRPRPL